MLKGCELDCRKDIRPQHFLYMLRMSLYNKLHWFQIIHRRRAITTCVSYGNIFHFQSNKIYSRRSTLIRRKKWMFYLSLMNIVINLWALSFLRNITIVLVVMNLVLSLRTLLINLLRVIFLYSLLINLLRVIFLYLY